MTVNELLGKLSEHNGDLEVMIRCALPQDEDVEMDLYPRAVVGWLDADTGQDTVIIAATQEPGS